MKSIDEASPRELSQEPVKLDLTTRLESLWIMLAILSGLAAAVLLRIGLVGGEKSRATPELLPFVPVALVLTVAFAVLRYATDNHYVIDARRRVISYQFKCLTFQTVTTYLTFNAVHAVMVNAVARRSKYSVWYEYQILLLDKRGRTHAASDFQKEGALERLNRTAGTLATCIGCVFYEGAAGTRYDATRRDRAMFVTPRQVAPHTPAGVLSLLTIACLFVGGIVFFLGLTWFSRG